MDILLKGGNEWIEILRQALKCSWRVYRYRKAMFIPIAAVASFMLVGYAAADKEKPEIKSNQIDLAYGEKFDVDSIDITDNKDSRDLIEVSADTSSLNVTQLGSYKVFSYCNW